MMIYLNTVSFAIGILIKETLNPPSSLFLFLVFLTITVLIVVSRNKTHKTILCVLFLTFGFLRMGFVNTSPDPLLLTNLDKSFSFTGVVAEEPDIRDIAARYTVSPSYPEREVPTQKSLVLVVAERFPEFKYGDRISVTGKIELPENFLTESGSEFDYVSFLSKDKIHFIVYRPELEKIGEGEGNKIVASLYLLKNNFIKNISKVIPEPDSSLLAGLIFGVKQSLGENLLSDFKTVGLIHIVVLSGYNITIIASAILYSTSYFGKRTLGFIFASVGILLFAVMVGLGATVMRASIMALIAILARHLGRQSDALRALFIAGFFMLLLNPLTLLRDPSFQLSFSATLGLILYSPFVYSLVSSVPKLRNIFPEKFALREIISSTFAVQLFVLPLLTKMSGTVSVIAFIVNLIVLPLIPYTMFFGFLTGLAGFLGVLGSPFALVFGIVSLVFTKIIIFITETGASIPFATINTGSLHLAFIILWYVFYTFLYFKLKTRLTPQNFSL